MQGTSLQSNSDGKNLLQIVINWKFYLLYPLAFPFRALADYRCKKYKEKTGYDTFWDKKTLCGRIAIKHDNLWRWYE